MKKAKNKKLKPLKAKPVETPSNESFFNLISKLRVPSAVPTSESDPQITKDAKSVGRSLKSRKFRLPELKSKVVGRGTSKLDKAKFEARLDASAFVEQRVDGDLALDNLTRLLIKTLEKGVKIGKASKRKTTTSRKVKKK